MIVKVLTDIKIKDLDRLFDYNVPSHLQDKIKRGMRVFVPFGGQKRMGYVIGFAKTSKYDLKDIVDVLDIIPTINEEAFKYLDHILKTNKNLFIRAVETIVPSELFLKYDKQIKILNKEMLSSELVALFKNKNKALVTKNFEPFKNEILRLINSKAIKVNKIYARRGQAKMVKGITFNKSDHYSRRDNYSDLIDFVIKNPNLRRIDLIKKGFSGSSVNTLIKNNVFTVNEIRKMRDVEFIEQEKIQLHNLNKDQKLAYNQINSRIDSYSINLLHGITGSGKTEVYMHLMKDVIKRNKKVLYLVPEITLIAPLMRQLNSRFKDGITHFNSNLSSGERYDSWSRIVNGDAKIIVGTRSSIFLPIEDLGLIVIDEEHDSSYRQVEGIQYQVIDIAKIRAKENNFPIILGSATPSVASMYNAKNNKYHLLELNKRATDQPLPTIHYIDMKEELRNGNTKVFSNLLYKKINERLNKQEQIILLFNRKGYAPFVMCRTCGYTPKCPSCDVSLTYYRQSNELRCHHCGFSMEPIEKCPQCDSKAIKAVGVGIEHIEYQVKKHFENARVVRMDANTTSRKGSHEKIWNDFLNKKYDILIGTQMISKGLDFPNVTLVGILMADLSLQVPSYLATESTYALITQMTGRSGRNIKGEAVVQGYNLDHYAIKAVDKGYDYFYEEAIYERKLSKYIPFYNVSQILVSSKSYLKAFQIASRLKMIISKQFEIVLGPAESIIRYLREEYRFVITIKDKNINTDKIFKAINKYETSDVGIYYYTFPEIM